MPKKHKTDTKERKKPGPPTKVNVKKAKTLIEEKGLTYEEAGKVLGVSATAVHNQVSKLIDPEKARRWREDKAGVLEDLCGEMIQTLSPDLIKDLVARRGMVDFGILYDKMRVEKGQAVEFVDVRHFLEMNLDQIRARKQALREQLAYSHMLDDDASMQSNDVIDVESSDLQSLGQAEGRAGTGHEGQAVLGGEKDDAPQGA